MRGKAASEEAATAQNQLVTAREAQRLQAEAAEAALREAARRAENRNAEIARAGFGSEVTLWGRGPHDSLLPIDEVAHAAGTIGYELMCALAPRVPVRTMDR